MTCFTSLSRLIFLSIFLSSQQHIRSFNSKDISTLENISVVLIFLTYGGECVIQYKSHNNWKDALTTKPTKRFVFLIAVELFAIFIFDNFMKFALYKELKKTNFRRKMLKEQKRLIQMRKRLILELTPLPEDVALMISKIVEFDFHPRLDIERDLVSY